MELKKLQYLEAVYRLQSMSAAAEEQFISQPAMSKSIHSLEEELGVELIRRTPRGIAFTEAGELFVRHAARILRAAGEAEEELRDLSDRTTRTVNFGVSNTAQAWLLPLSLADFAHRHEDFQVIAHEDTQQGMYEKLLAEEIDLAFTILPREGLPDELTAEPLMRAELKLLLPRAHRLASSRFIPIGELNGETIFSYPKGSILRRTIEGKCLEHGCTARITCVTLQLQTVYELVNQGAGLSHVITDPMTSGVRYGNLVARSFAEPVFFDEGILIRKGHYQNRAVREFIRYLGDIAIHPEQYAPSSVGFPFMSGYTVQQ